MLRDILSISNSPETQIFRNFYSSIENWHRTRKWYWTWYWQMVWQECCFFNSYTMGLLPDVYNCGLRMHRECRESFSRHLLQRKLLVSDRGMHHGTCITHVPWCMSGSLTRCDGENVPGIPGACATRNFTYLVRGPCRTINIMSSVLSLGETAGFQHCFLWM